MQGHRLWALLLPGWKQKWSLEHHALRQVLEPGALGKPRGSGWRGRWEGGSGWGTHVNPWLFPFNVWQNPLQKKKKNIMHLHMVKRLLFRQKLNPCEHTGFFFFSFCFKKYTEPVNTLSVAPGNPPGDFPGKDRLKAGREVTWCFGCLWEMLFSKMRSL